MTPTRIPFAQKQFTKRIKAATHIKPIFMSKDEFEVMLHRKILDVAEGEILSDANDHTMIKGLGQVGALELLMKVGLVLSELDIPSIENSTRENSQ